MSSKNKKKFQKPSSLTRLTENNENNQVSLLSRIFGSKKELDNARDNFYKKYVFETNINPLRFITFLSLLSFILCISMFFIERNNEQKYETWIYDGIVNIPPSDTLDFDSILDFSEKENFSSCNSKNPKKLLEGICDEPLSYVDQMNSTQSNSQLIFVIQFLLLFLLFFPLGTFFHRAIRNIKTLRYVSNISAEKSIVWIYFAIFLYFIFIFVSRWISCNDMVVFGLIFLHSLFLSFRIYKVFKEIYLGSFLKDFKKGTTWSIFPNKFKIWFVILFFSCLYNPSTITRLWGYKSENLSEFLEATRLMYISSITLGILCILTILMVVEVYKLQEIKNIKEGSIEIDPLED